MSAFPERFRTRVSMDLPRAQPYRIITPSHHRFQGGPGAKANPDSNPSPHQNTNIGQIPTLGRLGSGHNPSRIHSEMVPPIFHDGRHRIHRQSYIINSLILSLSLREAQTGAHERLLHLFLSVRLLRRHPVVSPAILSAHLITWKNGPNRHDENGKIHTTADSACRLRRRKPEILGPGGSSHHGLTAPRMPFLYFLPPYNLRQQHSTS